MPERYRHFSLLLSFLCRCTPPSIPGSVAGIRRCRHRRFGPLSVGRGWHNRCLLTVRCLSCTPSHSCTVYTFPAAAAVVDLSLSLQMCMRVRV